MNPTFSQASQELLSFPMRLLAELPVKLKIAVEASGIHREIILHLGLGADAREGGAIVFDGGEVQAIAVGVESERLRPSDFKGFCLRKLHDPSFRVNQQLALDGARATEGRALSLEHVLDTLELEFAGFEWFDATSRPSASPPIDVAA